MSKKYHLDQNNVAFIHCVNGAFAGIYTMLEMAKAEGKKKISKKKFHLNRIWHYIRKMKKV